MYTFPVLYTYSIKYLGFTFTSNNCDDADILKQMSTQIERKLPFPRKSFCFAHRISFSCNTSDLHN